MAKVLKPYTINDIARVLGHPDCPLKLITSDEEKLFILNYSYSSNLIESYTLAFPEKAENKSDFQIRQACMKLLCKSSIDELHMWIKASIENRKDFTDKRFLQEIRHMALVNIKDILNPDGSIKDLTKVPDSVTAAIQQVTSRKYPDGSIETFVKLSEKAKILKLATDLSGLSAEVLKNKSPKIIINLGNLSEPKYIEHNS